MRTRDGSKQQTDTCPLPVVSKAVIRGVEQETTDADTAYRQLFEENEALALFIRGRAIEIAPDSPLFEDIMLLSSQACLAISRQALANSLESLLIEPGA